MSRLPRRARIWIRRCFSIGWKGEGLEARIRGCFLINFRFSGMGTMLYEGAHHTPPTWQRMRYAISHTRTFPPVYPRKGRLRTPFFFYSFFTRHSGLLLSHSLSKRHGLCARTRMTGSLRGDNDTMIISTACPYVHIIKKQSAVDLVSADSEHIKIFGNEEKTCISLSSNPLENNNSHRL